MRILYLANNRVGWQILSWLKQQGDDVVGLVVHPEAKRRFGTEILGSAGLHPSRVFDGSRLREPAILQAIERLEPEIGVSAFFGYILRSEMLAMLPAGCVNIHPALLPWNRGAHPNVWSIVEGTPAGATLHYLDEGIDTGDIIAQREVRVDMLDTGASLYARLEAACLDLFTECWPLLRAGKAPRRPQTPGTGSSHRVKDLEKLDEIELDRSYPARELIKLLRARSFPPYLGAWFRDGVRKVHLRLHLAYEEDLQNEGDANAKMP